MSPHKPYNTKRFIIKFTNKYVCFYSFYKVRALETKDNYLTLWRPAAFGDFQEKNTETHVALCGNFSSLVSATDLVNGSKDAASLLVCTQVQTRDWPICLSP